MKEFEVDKLNKYAEILENYYNDMVVFDFVIENGTPYIVYAEPGRRSPKANLKIVMSMFCEGKITINEVIERLPYPQLAEILDTQVIVNTDELKFLAQGLGSSRGVCNGIACFSHQDAENYISSGQDFIYCCPELSFEDIDIIKSAYCKGVVGARGGMTSHAAVACRGLKLPCISGAGDFDELQKLIESCNNELVINGNDGKVYAGRGILKNSNIDLLEINMLRKLLETIVRYNIITSDKAILVWRLWNVIILNRRYAQKENRKRIVNKGNHNYTSFIQPSKQELQNIQSKLQRINNCGLLIEDMIDFLQSQISAHVSLGCHYKYMRPLLDPMKSMFFNDDSKSKCLEKAGTQLTGVEFFNINQYLDYLIDIYSIKIYFSTTFFNDAFYEDNFNTYSPLNYLDYTNPKGEGLIINTYKAEKIAIYINDVLIPPDKLPQAYHLLRRRQYHWSWYKDNNITKREIFDYLKSNVFTQEPTHSKKYYLCQEINLLRQNELTTVGKILLGENEPMKDNNNNNNIDYILNEVIARDYNVSINKCNDFAELIDKKDFKELIALELYEVYFWDERHEFDLELLREIINAVSDYFSDPETIRQIESGILQTLPSAIIISIVNKIWTKLKKCNKKKTTSNPKTSWERIEDNIKKIDKEFSNHDYILTNEIEQIFGVSREEIQPLLKLCGCKCFIDKNKSIWIKAGTSDARIKDILKEHHLKCKKK